MILTDGEITDLDDTIDQIVLGSDLPLSIIIVGIGAANFDKMDVLDGDDEPLYSKKYKKHWSRDIVQFVPYKDFKDGVKLTQKVLEEVPGQLTDYFKAKNIKPNARIHQNEEELRADQERKAQEESEHVDFYKDQKDKFIQRYRVDKQKQVTTILDTKGIPEENDFWINQKGN